jgi:two-component system, OmpR family, sensor kinase
MASWSLRTRLLAASLALVALGLLVADVATYRALRSSLYGRADAQLDTATSTIQRNLVLDQQVQATVEQLQALVPGVFVQIRSGDGLLQTQVQRAGDTFAAPALPAQLELGRVYSVPSLAPGEAGYRVAATRVGLAEVIVGIPLADASATLDRLVRIEVVVTLAVLVLAAAAGVWLVRLGLRPLADIEATAATITGGDRAGRVPVAVGAGSTEVGRLGAALNTMLDSLDAALGTALASEERMRRFVADASHELRTPVAAVRAYAELYRRGADSRPEDLARLLSRIESETERMGGLVDDLLLLTRLDEGRALRSDVVDVGAVAGDAVSAAQAVDPGREWALSVEGSVEVLGDGDRLRQVVDNLLANVRAHTPPGTPAGVSVFVEGRLAVVEVADSGPGVSVEEAERVFERFYRADPARARDSGGSGLGLSLVSAIVRAHGGTASVRSPFSGGAVFRVELPVLSAESAESAEGEQ